MLPSFHKVHFWRATNSISERHIFHNDVCIAAPPRENTDLTFFSSSFTTSCDIPVFNLVGALNIVDVHADLVVDIGRKVSAVGLHVWEHDSRPELPVV